MKKGKLIVFEGISGTGKETQAKLLQEFLQKKGIDAIVVYHPSPELKEILRLWRKNRSIDHVSEAYFLLADRYNRVKTTIEPALQSGVWVISLRNWVSALVYQAPTAKDREYIEKEFAWFEPVPDVLFLFDIDPDVSHQRALVRHANTGEPMGKFETKEFLTKHRNAYLTLAKENPNRYVVINAGKPIEEVSREICNVINTKIPKR